MNTAFYFSFFGSRDAINVIVAFLCAVWQFLYCVFRSYAGLFFPVRCRKTLAIVHKNKDCHFSSRGWRFFRHFVYEVYEQWNGGCRREALNIFLCAHRYSFCAFFAFAGFWCGTFLLLCRRSVISKAMRHAYYINVGALSASNFFCSYFISFFLGRCVFTHRIDTAAKWKGVKKWIQNKNNIKWIIKIAIIKSDFRWFFSYTSWRFNIQSNTWAFERACDH